MATARKTSCDCARLPTEVFAWASNRSEFLGRRDFALVEERNDERQADFRCTRCGRLWTERGEEVGFGFGSRFVKHLTPLEAAREKRLATLKRWLYRLFWTLAWAVLLLYLSSRARAIG